MFTSIETSKRQYHNITILKADQFMRIRIRPDDEQDVFEVCYNMTLRPNDTYPGFCETLPKSVAPPLDLDPNLVDKWRYTASPSYDLAKSNGTLFVSIKLIGTIFF